MNRIYRLVFNRCLGRYQVASELARTRGKSRGQSHGRSPRQSRVRGIVRSGTFNLRQLVTAGLLSLLLPTSALADAGSLASNLPSQATISHGRADISVSGADMHIQQHSHQLITNWQNFSIGENN